ncbi:MAG TPA: VTT domain-containing protein [Kofleriaceae bacterium]|nr:VTT domain-containing protein [Kofleriaceae bacterium]
MVSTHGSSYGATGHPAARWAKSVVAAVIVLVVAYILWSAWDHRAVMAWIRELHPVPFFFAMALLPAIGLPFTPFVMFAGASFGAIVGLIGSLIALAVNLVVCFWIARHMRGPLESLLRRFDCQLPDFRRREKGSLRFVVAVKLAPGVPGFVKHYGLGLAGVPFLEYFVVAMLISGMYVAAFVILGDSLFEHDSRRAVIAIGVLAGMTALVIWLRRRSARRACAAARPPAR